METTLKAPKATLDYPQEGEVITHPDYTIRVGTDWNWGVDRVEVAIDGGDWRECRFAAGYWWYDWAGYEPGRYAISARVHQNDGSHVTLPARRVEVEFDEREGRDGRRNGSRRHRHHEAD